MPEQMNALPSLWFNTDDHAPADRLDAMNELGHGLYDYRRAARASRADGRKEKGPTLRLRAFSLGGVAASSFENSLLATRSTGRLDPAFNEMMFLRVIWKGRVLAQSGDTQALLLPDSIHLMHARHTLPRIEEGSGISLRLSYESVGYDPSRHPRIMSFRTDGWIGQAVVAAGRSLFQSLPTLTPAKAKALEPSLIALVRALMSSDRLDDEAHASLSAVRAAAMKRYVLKHLLDDDLQARRLQSVFHASRATVFRAFEDVGGVARFVRQQRLEAVYRELRTVTPRRGIIRQIAEKYGFPDQCAFFRAFRSCYGLRPSDVLAGCRVARGAPLRDATAPSMLGVPNLASFWSSNGAGSPPAEAA
ncbi:MAG: AraC family transcriptional regulator [Pseudomonadota bacterium]